MTMTLTVQDAKDRVLARQCGEDAVLLVYPGRYPSGASIRLTVPAPGYYQIRLEDTLPPALVWLGAATAVFPIPSRMTRGCYSPRAFRGRKHVLYARIAGTEEAALRRNLALNPYDASAAKGIYPHASANAQTRDEAIFAPRNAIDGIAVSNKHGFYPYQSWGINKDPDAALRIEFGTPVDLDTLILTLRADFPHDSYWTGGQVAFSDGSSEHLSFTKTGAPQIFPIVRNSILWLQLHSLIKAEDASPFPALTQLEAWGRPAAENGTTKDMHKTR